MKALVSLEALHTHTHTHTGSNLIELDNIRTHKDLYVFDI